jgi:hypothetical protein
VCYIDFGVEVLKENPKQAIAIEQFVINAINFCFQFVSGTSVSGFHVGWIKYGGKVV